MNKQIKIALMILLLLAGMTVLMSLRTGGLTVETAIAVEQLSPYRVYHVLLHSPGPAWIEGTPFQEQPGVGEHVQYMRALHQQGLIVMGGPFLDNSGGMMIYKSADLADAQRVAQNDPAVLNGLLTVEVRPWMVVMESEP